MSEVNDDKIFIELFLWKMMVRPVLGLKTDKSDSQCKSHIKLKPVTYI